MVITGVESSVIVETDVATSAVDGIVAVSCGVDPEVTVVFSESEDSRVGVLALDTTPVNGLGVDVFVNVHGQLVIVIVVG